MKSTRRSSPSTRVYWECEICDKFLIAGFIELEQKIKKLISYERQENYSRTKEVVYTGKILHLDGDKKYSEKSIMYYKKMGLKAIVKNIPENNPCKIEKYSDYVLFLFSYIYFHDMEFSPIAYL